MRRIPNPSVPLSLPEVGGFKGPGAGPTSALLKKGLSSENLKAALAEPSGPSGPPSQSSGSGSAVPVPPPAAPTDER